MQKVFFFLSNSNHLKIYAPIANSFLQKGFEVLCISSDQYYNQHASADLAKTNFSYVELTGSVNGADWWKIPY